MQMEKLVAAYFWEESLTVVDKLTNLRKLRVRFT
jgi:hypothetical protein